MKRVNFKFKSMALVLLALGLSSNLWGGETAYKTALFGSSYNSIGVNNYSSSWSATNNSFTVNLAYWNNNNNGWSYIKAGQKNTAYVGTITTNAAIDKAIAKVTITIDAVTAKNINSIKLYSGTSSTTITTEEGSFAIATGAQSVTISSPAINKYYKISADCKTGSNGVITVSKVEYFAAASSAYTVTFNAGSNGTCSTSSLKEESAGVGVTLPAATPNTGYEFIGWSTSSSPTEADAGAAGDTYKPSSDCTLYAYYKQFHMVTFLNNGAAATGAEGVDSQGKKKYYHGEQLGTLPTVGTMISCDTEHSNVFQGWTASQISGTQSSAPTYIDPTTVVNDDNIVLRAVWAAVDTSK